MYSGLRNVTGRRLLATPAQTGVWKKHSALVTTANRHLSELYTKDKLAAKPKQQPLSPPAEPAPAPAASAVPEPKQYDRRVGELRPREHAEHDAETHTQELQRAAEEFSRTVHTDDWEADEVWMRYIALPPDAYQYLRIIDINRALAVIRGSARHMAISGKAAPSTNTLNKMLVVYGRAKRAGVVADRYTYQELITMNVSLMNFRYAKRWLNEMLKRGITPTIRPYRTLLKGYSSIASEIDSSRALWHEIRRKIDAGEIISESRGEEASVLALDRETYTCIIKAEVNVGNFSAALRLFQEMRDSGIEQDITVRNVILKGILDHKGMDAGIQEVEFIIRDGLELNAFSFNILLAAAVREGDKDLTRSLLAKAAASGVIPSTSVVQSLPFDPVDTLDIMMQEADGIETIRVYNTLITAATRRNQFSQALRLLSHMRTHDVQPNIITYSILLDALSKAGRYDEAHAVYSQIVSEGTVKPDTHVIGIMVDVCGRQGKVHRMHEYRQALKQFGLAPSIHIYNSILAALARQPSVNLKEVIQTMHSMLHERPLVRLNTRTINSVFSAFARRAHKRPLDENRRRFLRAWYENTKEKYFVDKDAYTYVLALDAFTRSDCLDDAVVVYREMLTHAELDRSVLRMFAESPARMLDLMRLASANQEFAVVLGLWRNWQALCLPPSEKAVAFMLFACDQLGHIAAAKETVFAMLSQSESGPASMPVGAATSVLSPDSNDGSETEPQAFVQQSLDLDSVGVTYRPEMVGESALAMFIGMAVKHSTLEDIMPVVELWAAAAGNSLHMSAHGCRRELSERTVAKILALLRHSPTEQSEHIADRFLAFVEDNFPESMPL